MRCPPSSSASVCFAVCLLSLAWALVLYARACSLIRPGHLQMTPAAILCRLVWRVGSLLHFTRMSKMHLLHDDASIISMNRVVYSLFPGGHVRLSLCCPHALHSYLQILGPGSYWYVVVQVVMWCDFITNKLLPRVTWGWHLVMVDVIFPHFTYFYIRCALAWYDLLDGVPTD